MTEQLIPQKRTIEIQGRIPAELHSKLKAAAAEYSCTMNDMINQAIVHYLADLVRMEEERKCPKLTK